jgi:hypothetical protein
VKIRITMDIDPEYADAGHPTGVTGEGYEKITGLLGQVGENIDVEAEPGD